jgi:hypothetical protein
VGLRRLSSLELFPPPSRAFCIVRQATREPMPMLAFAFASASASASAFCVYSYTSEMAGHIAPITTQYGKTITKSSSWRRRPQG